MRKSDLINKKVKKVVKDDADDFLGNIIEGKPSAEFTSLPTKGMDHEKIFDML